MTMKKKIGFVALTILVLTGAVLISQESVLQKMGDYLVHQGPLEPAEAIIVLSGSGTGNRIAAGAMLFKRGLGKTIVISGEEIYPGYYSHTLMKNYAASIGVPEDRIITGEIEGETSTWGEGIDNLKKLKENNFKSFILVTSAFHTNRAHAVYEKLIDDLGYDFKFTVYPAKDNSHPTKDWWKTRAGKKTILLEYLSTLNFYLEH
jgi:uncharacterized SAM-binding protein YcdF (DUF218 family)